MSRNMSQSPSTAPPIPNLTDFTALASMFQDIAQVMLRYGKTSETNAPKQAKQYQSKQSQSEQSLDAQTQSLTPPLSNQAKRRECHKEFCYNPVDSRSFADKEMAQFFAQEYKRGNFRNEIRYYYVPAHIVLFEHKLLKQHQQKDILSLLSNVYNELDLKIKLIAYIDKDKDSNDLPLMQLSDSISQSLKLLHTIYTHLNSFKLVHKTMLPKRKRL